MERQVDAGLPQAKPVTVTIAVQGGEVRSDLILPAGATGDAWAAEAEGALMRFEAGGWTRLEPRPGHIGWITDESLALVFDGAWQPLSTFLDFEALVAATSPGGARIRFAIREEDVTAAGATTASTMVIPARSIPLRRRHANPDGRSPAPRPMTAASRASRPSSAGRWARRRGRATSASSARPPSTPTRRCC